MKIPQRESFQIQQEQCLLLFNYIKTWTRLVRLVSQPRSKLTQSPEHMLGKLGQMKSPVEKEPGGSRAVFEKKTLPKHFMKQIFMQTIRLGNRWIMLMLDMTGPRSEQIVHYSLSWYKKFLVHRK